MTPGGHACITVVTIRNVPDDLNERLKQRAQERGQSLQQFLLRELAYVAERSPLEDRLRAALAGLTPVTTPIGTADILAALEAGRAERDARVIQAALGRDA